MTADVLFEQRWPVDEEALRRTRRRWIVVWVPLAVLGDADRKHEFMLPGRIGSGGNWSTFSDEQAAAFHAAVSRFTTVPVGEQ